MRPLELLREMFALMVVNKDADLAATYYHPDFILMTNGQTQTFDEFEASHRTVYATPIQYAVTYDEDAWVETSDRVAGRVWITTTRPDEAPTTIEVILVATYLDGRIHRLWELTWPDWSRLPAFDEY
jgi:hypothetical protein